MSHTMTIRRCISPATASSRRRRASIILVATLVFLTLCASGCGGDSSQGLSPRPSALSQTAGPAARGQQLYQSDGCAGCHSLNGTRLTGPSWKGLAGSRVELSNGRIVTASRAYLTRHITEPNAMTVRGYPAGVMAQAIESLGLKANPSDVKALVAFIESLRKR
ncbi:MAG: c-type cytochrome [Solirubrobacteraceae bacterium]